MLRRMPKFVLIASLTTALAATAAPARAGTPAGHLSARISAAASTVAGRAVALQLSAPHTGAARAARWSLAFDGKVAAKGTKAPAKKVAHTFRTSGWHTATLKVTPTHGRTVVATRKILVLTPVAAPTVAPAATPVAEPVAVHPDTSSATSISPTSGPVGTTITVTGTGFTSPATATINNVAVSSVTVVSATLITLRMPGGAGTGSVMVTSNGSTTNAGVFTATLGIVSSSTVGPPTSAITVSGSGFKAYEEVDLYTGQYSVGTTYAAANGTFANVATNVSPYVPPGATQIAGVGRADSLAAATAFTVRTDWTQLGFGGNRRGWNPYDNLSYNGQISQLGQAWRNTLPGGVTSTPTVFAGGVYVSASNAVREISATTGNTVWTATLAGVAYSTPAVSGANVYVADSEGVYALSASSGAVVWHKTLTQNLEYSSPTVVGGLVYVSGSGSALALNASTGAVVWTFTASAGTSYGSVTVVNGVAYFGATDNKVYALDATAGTLKWSYLATGYTEGVAAVVNGTVYIGASDGYLYALDATTGGLTWSYNTGAAVYGSPTVGGDDRVYVANSNGKVVSLDADTGALNWAVTAKAGFNSQLISADNAIWGITTNGQVLALQAYDGSTIWTASADGAGTFDSGVVVANNTVYAGSAYGHLFAYTVAGGQSEVA